MANEHQAIENNQQLLRVYQTTREALKRKRKTLIANKITLGRNWKKTHQKNQRGWKKRALIKSTESLIRIRKIGIENQSRKIPLN